MIKYEFHIGYPETKVECSYLRQVEEYLNNMQDRGWEFMGITPAQISSGYTRRSSAYIFRRKKVDTLNTSDNDKI